MSLGVSANIPKAPHDIWYGAQARYIVAVDIKLYRS